MKRLLSGIILMLFFITNVFAVNVFALDKEPITYGVNESFIIIVPSGFTFNRK